MFTFNKDKVKRLTFKLNMLENTDLNKINGTFNLNTPYGTFAFPTKIDNLRNVSVEIPPLNRVTNQILRGKYSADLNIQYEDFNEVIWADSVMCEITTQEEIDRIIREAESFKPFAPLTISECECEYNEVYEPNDESKFKDIQDDTYGDDSPSNIKKENKLKPSGEFEAENAGDGNDLMETNESHINFPSWFNRK